MRKLTLLLSLAVLLLMASCAKDEPLGGDDKVIYEFTAQLPGYIDSRAIGDGKKADELFFWVFDENNHELEALRRHNISFNNSGQATVQVPLTPGHKYSFVFWAQNKECKAYDPYNSDRISIDYWGDDENPVLANDDLRDAFYAIKRNIQVSTDGEMVQQRIRLQRPFAQLNYGISKEVLKAVTDAGVDLTGARAFVYVSQAYTQFGLLEGKPINMDEDAEIEFNFNGMPSGVPVDSLTDIWYNDPIDSDLSGYRTYVWLSFNYICTTTDQYSLIDTHIVIETADGQTFRFPEDDGEKTVRIKGNERTNILADFFTTDVTFNIVIDQNFFDYDHTVIVDNSQNSPSHQPNPKAPFKSNIATDNKIKIPTFNLK